MKSRATHQRRIETDQSISKADRNKAERYSCSALRDIATRNQDHDQTTNQDHNNNKKK